MQFLNVTGDSHMKWQALEGLGAISFNKGNITEAEKHFSEALKYTGENEAAHQRILGKLKHVVRKEEEMTFQRYNTFGSTPRQNFPVSGV